MKKIIFGVVFAAVCVFLLYDAISSSISPYYSVSEIITHRDEYVGKDVRVYGRIHDFKYGENGTLFFNLSDLNSNETMIYVIYRGPQQQIQSGRKAAVVGKFTRDGKIIAEKLLMKCPSKYE